MQALSVVAPFGIAISTGRKSLEIRRWRPESLPVLDLAIVQNHRRLTREDPVDPEGTIVAVVDVRRIRRWMEDELEAACSTIWEDGWLAWELENVRKVIDGPRVPAKRRLYEIDYSPADLCCGLG